MKIPPETKQSRREMLRGTARWAILGTLGVLSGALLLRKAGRSTSQDCPRTIPCRNCSALARCNLPRALSEKRANKR